MAEPRTDRGRSTKGLIVRAAAALMYERGIRATSLDDVLAAAGCGKSQLYHYFAGKDDLVAAVLESQLADVLADQARFDLSTWSGWKAWFDALLHGQEARGFSGCPFGSLAVEASAMGPEMRALVADAFARWHASLARALDQMKRDGKLSRSSRPRRLADATMACVQGGYLLSTAEHDLRPMRQSLAAAYAQLRASRA